METINFIKPVNPYRTHNHAFVWWCIISCLLGLVSLMFMVVWYIDSTKELKTLSAEKQQYTQRKKTIESLEQEIATTKKGVRKTKKQTGN